MTTITWYDTPDAEPQEVATHAIATVLIPTEQLVQILNDTGVLWWSGSFTGNIDYLGDDTVSIEMANEVTGEGDTPTEFVIKGDKLASAFVRFQKNFSFSFANGELVDFDIDAFTADQICQYATYGEVRFA